MCFNLVCFIVRYLNAILKLSISITLQVDEIYAHALTLQRDNQMNHLRKIWVKCPTVYPKQLDIPADDADTGVPSEQPPIPEGAAELKKLPSHFWVNRISGNSQWTTPYYANSYQCVDIDIQSFHQVLLLRDSIENWYVASFSCFVVIFCPFNALCLSVV